MAPCGSAVLCCYFHCDVNNVTFIKFKLRAQVECHAVHNTRLKFITVGKIKFEKRVALYLG